jgi:hypothetical protein
VICFSLLTGLSLSHTGVAAGPVSFSFGGAELNSLRADIVVRMWAARATPLDGGAGDEDRTWFLGSRVLASSR